MKNLDKLLTDPNKLIRELVPIDTQSTVPPNLQFVGDYYLNQSGVHRFFNDEEGQLDIHTVYSIPFYAYLSGSNIHLHFFLPNGEIDIVTLMDSLSKYFKSLGKRDMDRIARWVGYSVMKDLGAMKGTL